jgi:hypothetical protein
MSKVNDGDDDDDKLISIQSSNSPNRSSRDNSIDDEENFDQKCPICLEQFDDPALLDGCFHKFCFVCICSWISRVPSCPLCKQSFKTIIHHIVTEHQFDRVSLERILSRTERSDTRNARSSMSSSSSSRARTRGYPHDDHRYSRRFGSNYDNDRPTSTTSTTTAPTTVVESGGIISRREVYANLRRIKPLEFGAAANLLPSAEVATALAASRGTGAFVSDALTRHRRLDDTAQRLATHWSKLEPFVERDLRVISGVDDVGVLLLLVKSLVSQHNVRRTDDAQQYLGQFLPRAKVDILFKEMVAFAAAPFAMQVYDSLTLYYDESPPTVSLIDSDHERTNTNNDNNNNNNDNDDDNEHHDERGRSRRRSTDGDEHRRKRRRRRRSTRRHSHHYDNDNTADNNHSQSLSSTNSIVIDDDRALSIDVWDPVRRSTFCSCRELRRSDRRLKCDACMEVDYLRKTIGSLDDAIAHETEMIQQLKNSH